VLLPGVVGPTQMRPERGNLRLARAASQSRVGGRSHGNAKPGGCCAQRRFLSASRARQSAVGKKKRGTPFGMTRDCTVPRIVKFRSYAQHWCSRRLSQAAGIAKAREASLAPCKAAASRRTAKWARRGCELRRGRIKSWVIPSKRRRAKAGGYRVKALARAQFSANCKAAIHKHDRVAKQTH